MKGFHRLFLGLFLVITTAVQGVEESTFDEARESAKVAGYSLSEVQRWLHEVALTKIDPETKLYISHPNGSGRYREALWRYDDAAADTYPSRKGWLGRIGRWLPS